MGSGEISQTSEFVRYYAVQILRLRPLQEVCFFSTSLLRKIDVKLWYL